MQENVIENAQFEQSPVVASLGQEAPRSSSIQADVTQSISYNLTGVKLDKLGIFMPYFGEDTEEFVYKCSGRGDQSWKNLAQRIHDLDIADENLSAYVARLYEDFELNMLYDPLQIIKMVGTIRRELRMPIEEQSQKWYLQQVSNIFLIEKVMDKTSGYPKLIGYKLLFRLKP